MKTIKTAVLSFIAAVLLAGCAAQTDSISDSKIENKVRECVLCTAAAANNLELVSFGIENGLDPNQSFKDNKTALHFAAHHGNLAMVKLLLSAGASPNIKEYEFGGTPLLNAIIQNHPDVVKVLLTAGADPTGTTNDGIKYSDFAIIEGKHEILRLLDSARADKENISTSEECLLCRPAGFGETSEVKRLLDEGADPNAANKDKWTALMFASGRAFVPIVNMLLAAGANPNAGQKDGVTALMWAAVLGHGDIVKILLNAGASPNAVNNIGETALMAATGKHGGHAEVVKLLLSAGANANLIDNYGNTALSRAKKNGHWEIVRLLEAAGAK